MRVLVVDDNVSTRIILRTNLSEWGYEVVDAGDGEAAVASFREAPFPIVITDLRMPGMDGLELMSRLQALPGGAESDIIIVTAHGDMDSAIAALRLGAYEYLHKPVNVEELQAVVARSAEHQSLLRQNQDLTFRFDHEVREATEELREELHSVRRALLQVAGVGQIVNQSPAMQTLVEETRVYHRDPAVPVLIEGETGTGKEIIARLIHYGQGDVDTPLVAVNCAAFAPELFESELFGHEGGAFTGSTRKGAPGKLQLAGRGTLFLDEVGEMPLALQPKLLRVLEDRQYFRVGGVKRLPFQARIVCATNRDLQHMVAEGRFRRDLYHRLRVGYIHIPPLRERPADLLALAEFFLDRECRARRKTFSRIAPAAAERLRACTWPGNIRELENAIARAVLTERGPELTLEHLDAEPRTPRPVPESPGGGVLVPEAIRLPEGSLSLDHLCDTVVRKAYEKAGGNRSEAARYLGLSRSAFCRRLDRVLKQAEGSE